MKMTNKPKTILRADALAENYVSALEALRNGVKNYIVSGYDDLDKKLPAWLHNGHLIIVAARPSMGKTAFSQQLSENIAENGKTSLFFTLEMGSHEVTERSISRRSGVPVPTLKTGEIANNQWGDIATAIGEFSELPFLVDDSTFDLDTIIEKARAVAKNLENEGLPPLGCIIIDYLQMVAISRSGSHGNRNIEVGEIATAFKRLAKELDIPVIALAQLDRGVESRTDKRPTLSDLRESGQIEQDADLVLFLYRDDYYTKKESEDPGVCEVIAAKNRHGATDTVRMAFLAERIMFGGVR